MMAFIEVTGPIAFHHVRNKVHPGILQLWAHFRAYAMFFMRYRDGQHTEPQIRAAQNELFLLAKYAHQHFGGKLMTVLLHRAVVHIPEQALAIGPTAWYNEASGERDIRRTKSKITNHSTRRPAQHAANVCLADMCLELVKVEQPDIDAHMEKPTQQPAPGTRDDTDEHGVCLQGPLREANTGEEGDEAARTMMMHCRARSPCLRCSACLVRRRRQATLGPCMCIR